MHGRVPTPVLPRVDSKSGKLASRTYEHWGLDAHNLVNSRKRQMLTGSGVRILAVHVPTTITVLGS